MKNHTPTFEEFLFESKNITKKQINFVIKELHDRGKSVKYIAWERDLLKAGKIGEVSDDTANIITSQEYLDL